MFIFGILVGVALGLVISFVLVTYAGSLLAEEDELARTPPGCGGGNASA